MSILHQSTHLAQQQLKCPKSFDTWNTCKFPKFYSMWAAIREGSQLNKTKIS